MSAPIPPALTPDEWARVVELDVYPGHSVAGDVLSAPEDVAHAAMALGNHKLAPDHRGKLTPLMVRQLREAAAWHREHGGPTVADGLDAIASALAAVLPPHV